MFAKVVSKRDRDTIVEVLAVHVRPGSTLVTDCWKGYYGIEAVLGMYHLTVYHSKWFKNNETGACTNHIEGTWSGINDKIPPRNKTTTLISGHLLEFIWRRKNQNRLWDALFDAFRTVAY
jgi:hypothetical protein